MKKLRFLRTVTADFYTARTREWGDKTYLKNYVFDPGEKGEYVVQGSFTDLVYENGDVAENIPTDSYIEEVL